MHKFRICLKGGTVHVVDGGRLSILVQAVLIYKSTSYSGLDELPIAVFATGSYDHIYVDGLPQVSFPRPAGGRHTNAWRVESEGE